jgi:hypothetical protein
MVTWRRRILVAALGACAGCGAILGATDELGFGPEPGTDAGNDVSAADAPLEDASPDSPDAPGTDAGTLCIPDPEAIQDASADHYAFCDDAGSPIDLLQNKDNCGACGHRCITTLCSQGRCGVETLDGLDGGGLYVGAVDETRIYAWVGTDLYVAPVDGGAPLTTLLSTDDAGFNNPSIGGVRVDQDAVYVRVYNGLEAVPLSGGDPSWKLTSGAIRGPGGIALSDDAIFVAATSNVLQVDKATGDASVIASSVVSAHEVAATPDGGAVFWLSEPWADGSDAGGGLFVIRNGSSRALNLTLPAPRGIGIDDTYVYWGDFSTGTISRLPLDADFGATPEIVAQTPGQSRFDELSVLYDEGHVYWMASPGVFLFRRAKCGGPTTVLAKLQAGPVGGALSADFLYFGGYHLFRIAK